MKRRELILVVSLDLFNREGEANLSAVDIANELDISPGNLYYHYRGKEELVAELFSRFEDGLSAILRESADAPSSLGDNWLRFYVILEKIYYYRFFYRNLSDILQKYPALEARGRRLIDMQYDFILNLLSNLAEEGVFENRSVNTIGVEDLTNGVLLTVTYWFSYQYLRNRRMEQHDFIQSAILQIMAQVAPYVVDSRSQFMAECHQLYRQKAEDQ